MFYPNTVNRLGPVIDLKQRLIHQKRHIALFKIPSIQTGIIRSKLRFFRLKTDRFPPNHLSRVCTRLNRLSKLPKLGFSVRCFRGSTRVLFQYTPTTVRTTKIRTLLISRIAATTNAITSFLGLPFIAIYGTLLVGQRPNIPPCFAP